MKTSAIISLREHRTLLCVSKPDSSELQFRERPDEAWITNRRQGVEAASPVLVRPESMRKLSVAAKRDASLQRLDHPLISVDACHHVTSHGLVGFLQAGAVSVEVFPKYVKFDKASQDAAQAPPLDQVRRGFIELLDFCGVTHFRPGSAAQRDLARQPMAEWMLYGMAQRLRDCLQRGVRLDYVEKDEQLGIVRGRILLERQLRQGRGLPLPLHCRYERHEHNTPLARLLALFAELLGRFANASSTRRLADQASHMLVGISPSTAVAADLANVRFHRQTDPLAQCIDDLKLLLGRRRHDFADRRRQASGWSLSWDMATVFEKYVERILKRYSASLGDHDPLRPRVWCQQHVGHLAPELPNQNAKFGQIPDIVVEYGTGMQSRAVIIDAKYKRPGSRSGDRLRPSESDVRQVLAYANLWNRAAKGSDSVCDTVMLVYPRERDDNDGVDSVYPRERDDNDGVDSVYPRERDDNDGVDSDKQAWRLYPTVAGPNDTPRHVRLLVRTVPFGQRPDDERAKRMGCALLAPAICHLTAVGSTNCT